MFQSSRVRHESATGGADRRPLVAGAVRYKVFMYVHTYMGSKTITVTEEAYERLKARKREGESFTDTLLRLAGEQEGRWDGYGALRDADGFREAVEEGRETFDEDAADRHRRMFGTDDG
jgi:predicted CopG family antitoxin